MTVNVLKVAVVALASFSSSVGAFSTAGAGSCGAGDTSINNAVASNVHITSTSGPLAAAGVTFSVAGAQLTAGTPATVAAGTDLAWSVDASGAGYEGIFVRVEAAGDFTHVGDPAFVDDALLCASIAGVLGVDHFNKDLKTSVTGTTNFDAAGTATVDVVVVFSLTQWAHSTFSLTVEAATGDTPAPVDAGATPAPVDSGVTPAPVDSGVTPAPVDSGLTPAPTPVAVPSPVTDPPTADVPTADGECPEGKGKGKDKDKGKGKGDYDSGKGKGMGKKDGKMMKCKKEKTPKEPKTPKAGKGGKEKGYDDDSSVRRRK